jgi:Tfp pilus assembly protein PilN
MIEINLLPGAPRKKAAAAGPSFDSAAFLAGLTERMKNVWLITGVGGSVLVLLIVAGLYFKQGHDRTTSDNRLDKALTDSTRYAAVLTERDQLIAKRDTLQRQVNLIKSIDDDRYIWPHIMDEVSKALPQYTWLTNLQYSGAGVGIENNVALPKPAKIDTVPGKPIPKPKPIPTTITKEAVTIRLTGRTVDIQALTRFMRDLAASPFLQGVTVERADPGTDQGKEMYQFTLSMSFRRQDSTSLAVRRAPLVLSGSGGR